MKIEMVHSRDHHEVFKINGLYLHSKYKPLEQAEKFAQEKYKKNYIHMLFGYGNGYLVEALLNKFSNNEILIVIDPLIIHHTISPEISRNNVYYFHNEDFRQIESLINSIEHNYNNQYNIICSFNYDKIFTEEYVEFLKSIRDIQQSKVVNDNTVLLRAENWQNNFIDNIESIIKDGSISYLNEVYSYPVIVASGGPSLTKQLPLLKKIRENVILIAAGSTINSLLVQHIEPDYILSIDGHENNWKQFEGLDLKDSTLIYSMPNHPKIRTKFKDAFCFSSEKNKGINKTFLEKGLGIDLSFLPGGGSVAHYALSFANYITIGPIALIGQDLAYTNNQKHAAGNKQISDLDKLAADFIKIEGYYGEDVLSDISFNAMKIDFEKMMRNPSLKEKVYNCTEGGCKIHGMQQLDFSSFTSRFVKKTKISLYKADKKLEESKINSLIIKEQISNCEEILEKLKVGIKKMNRNKSLISFDSGTIKALNEIDKLLQQKLSMLPIQYIMEHLEIYLAKNSINSDEEYSSQKFRKILQQNLYTYESLERSISNCLEKLEKLG